jgi:hypothetical protein
LSEGFQLPWRERHQLLNDTEALSSLLLFFVVHPLFPLAYVLHFLRDSYWPRFISFASGAFGCGIIFRYWSYSTGLTVLEQRINITLIVKNLEVIRE